MKHAIILGCGRSGTSIFGELFDAIPGYRYFSEIDFDEYIEMDFSAGPIAIKVPRESQVYPSTQGLSIPLDRLLEKCPDVKIFWQVRHPLDTICSLKVGISKNWGHHPKPEDWQDWLSRPLIEQCAHHWVYLNTVGYEKVSSGSKVTTFESAIQNPKEFARIVCEQLEVPFEDIQDDLKPWIARVQDKNNSKFVEAETSRPYSTKDHSVRVGRWRENMTDKELESVLPMIRDTASQFGYQLP